MVSRLLESFFIFGPLPAAAEKGTYIPLFVIASYAVAAFGSYTGLFVANLIVSTKLPHKKLLFRWLSAFAYGSGFWAMHFIGMLAYKTNISISYNGFVTLLSLAVSVLAMYAVLSITRVSEKPSKLRIVVGAVLMGLGISAMHFLGMEAMEMNASLRFIPSLFFLSIIIAIVASEMALWIVLTLSRVQSKNARMPRVLAALIMGAGICGAFYVG
ncbi:MAG: MHYT domain-containing protein, partial [Alphaproteobacteria bacterium]|nr:MHYT domain-containing protein [Alphaproteobacteria bacterium]